MRKLHLLLCAVLTFGIAASCAAKVEVEKLRVEMQTNPIGVGEQTPRFMWQISSNKQDVVQTAYRIIVAASEQDLRSGSNLIWDSGNVQSDNTLFIPYEGPALESRKTYFWRVKSWTNKGETAWSDISKWTMALMSDADWRARWIGLDRSASSADVMRGNTRLTARYLRKEFSAPQKVKKAGLYISGLGFYECYINGKKVGEDVLAPTATDYTKHVNYNTYDVTDMLQAGENTLGVILGNGRYFSMRLDHGVRHFGFPKLLVQLEIEGEDGPVSVVSDDTWKVTANGPIISNNEFDGEEYDARLEMSGWASNGYDDSKWTKAELVEAPGGRIIAQTNPNIRVMKEIKPVKITPTSRGTYILDMGQNMVGWLDVSLKGKKDKPVKMVFAELLKGTDSLYMDNLRSAKVTDIYTPAHDGAFDWEPSFTYHGFRFVEISGLDGAPSLADFTGKVIYDRMKDVGTFESSNKVLNQIFKNAYWGITGNYRSMPTDCPQRDERMGWLGDRATGCYGESFLVEQALLYEKWVRDIEDSQKESGSLPDVSPDFWDVRTENVTWPSAFISAINMLYEQYGDVRPIKRHYAAMKKWMDHMTTNYMTDYILTKDNFGDWCMPPERQELIHSQDPARKTDGAILSTTFFYNLLRTMSKYAVINDKPEDKAYFDDLALKMKNAYNEKYLNKETGQYGNNTVTANILSLMLDLTPDEYRDKVFRNVVEKTEEEFGSHVSTGLVGIQYLMRGLTKYGRPDLAYTIATNTTYPSWGYMIEKGATTIWELWNGDTADPAMNSANHVMLLGDLIIWYYESLAGIGTDKEQVGFKKINMSPVFPRGLDYVKASYESVRGMIRSEWKREGNMIEWKVEVPANSSAAITLPYGLQLYDQKGGIKNVVNRGKALSFDIPSGSYKFRLRME